MDNRTDEQLAESLWNYNRLGMSLEPADVIIVLCSHDIQVADRAVSLGIPREKIWIENRSTNTGENVSFTRRLLTQSGQVIRKAIVVQKPYMERRAYATFKKVWPEPEIIVTSPQTLFYEYKSAGISREDLINIIVGDTQRIKFYPEKGFQIGQEIPDEVWRTCEELVKRGYSKRLVK